MEAWNVHLESAGLSGDEGRRWTQETEESSDVEVRRQISHEWGLRRSTNALA